MINSYDEDDVQYKERFRPVNQLGEAVPTKQQTSSGSKAGRINGGEGNVNSLLSEYDNILKMFNSRGESYGGEQGENNDNSSQSPLDQNQSRKINRLKTTQQEHRDMNTDLSSKLYKELQAFQNQREVIEQNNQRILQACQTGAQIQSKLVWKQREGDVRDSETQARQSHQILSSIADLTSNNSTSSNNEDNNNSENNSNNSKKYNSIDSNNNNNNHEVIQLQFMLTQRDKTIAKQEQKIVEYRKEKESNWNNNTSHIPDTVGNLPNNNPDVPLSAIPEPVLSQYYQEYADSRTGIQAKLNERISKLALGVKLPKQILYLINLLHYNLVHEISTHNTNNAISNSRIFQLERLLQDREVDQRQVKNKLDETEEIVRKKEEVIRQSEVTLFNALRKQKLTNK